jgi:hypothetical protein
MQRTSRKPNGNIEQTDWIGQMDRFLFAVFSAHMFDLQLSIADMSRTGRRVNHRATATA